MQSIIVTSKEGFVNCSVECCISEIIHKENMENAVMDMDIGAIIAAVIAAYALVRTTSTDYQDKIYRSLWSYEQYLACVGKFLEVQSSENASNYRAAYYIAYFYMEEDLRILIKNIDEEISREKFSRAKELVLELSNRYTCKYNIKRFYLRKNGMCFRKKGD